MAKSIKVIKCPQCGSTQKTEIEPEHYRCNNCNTEYFLDNDDININVNNASAQSQPPVVNRNTLYLIIAIFIIPLMVMVGNILIKGKQVQQANTFTFPKYDVGAAGSMVYQNTTTGKAVYVRLMRENIVQSNGESDYVNTHVFFIDPVSKKQFKDQVLFRHIPRLDDHYPLFSVFPDHSVYMLYPGTKLFIIDRTANQLVDITQTLADQHPELSSGLAEVQLDDYGFMKMLTNTGSEYYYMPAKNLLVTERKDLSPAFTALEPDTLLQFNQGELRMLVRTKGDPQRQVINLTPGRKYFNPHIMYIDKQDFIITTGVNASEEAPVLLQYIDRKSGKIIWTRPAHKINYENVVKCSEGFAVEYNTGKGPDYVSGVLVISPAGKVISNYTNHD